MKLYTLVDFYLDICYDVAGVYDSKEKALQAAEDLGLTEDDYVINEYELNQTIEEV